MRKFFLTLLFLIAALCVNAQSEFISNSRVDSLDNLVQLDGKRGVMLVSKSPNLVVNVTNVPDAIVTNKGLMPSGLYEYDVVVGPDDSNPKVEVSIRGDVNITSFVARPKKNFYVAYLIELVATPIDLQDQTKGGAILDAKKCEVDFVSPFKELKIDVSPLLGAEISTHARAGQTGVYETKVIVPIDILKNAHEAMIASQNTYEEHNRSLNSSSTDADFQRDDELKSESDKAAENYNNLSVIRISSVGTNTLTVSLDGMSPREKKSYAVLLLNKVKKEYVSDCSAHMAEAGRFFGLREYESAKKEYENALSSKDTPANLVNSIKTQIAQCDSCAVYQNFAVAALTKIRDMKKSGTVSQSDLAKYAFSAAEFLKVVNKYNPSNYYSERISKIEKMIGNLPMDFQVTVKRWAKNVSGFYEAGPLPNVEVWGYYGSTPILVKSYSSDRRFSKMVEGSSDFKKLGTSDNDGVIKMELARDNLPSVLFFRPNGYNNQITIERKDMSELMRQSEGDYMVRQFRLKMYVNN